MTADRLIRGERPPWPITTAIACAGVVVICAIDYAAGPRYNISILQSIPLLIAAYGRRRRVLWLIALLAIAAAFLAIVLKGPVPDRPDFQRYINRSLLAFALLVIAFALHLFVGTLQKLESSRGDLEDRHRELASNHTELSAREEEIARQNEELQSQTEELERQSEQLRVNNDELVRRERMLESLLALSRSLVSSTRRDETMEKICGTLGELINGPHTAVAIKERRGDQIHIICHDGFGPDGPEVESWPYVQSFAQLVLERGRTGYLEDINLRPELRIPQPKTGPRLRAVLAAPLHVGGKAVGSLEVYHTQKHTWSDEQVTLIESLAAQTSISLEAAALFERIEEERNRLKVVLETVPFGIAIANASATEIRVNPAGAAMLNVTPDANLNTPAVLNRMKVFRNGRLLSFEDWPVVRACVRGELISNEQIDVLLSTGRRVSLLSSAAPIHGRGGEILGAVVGWADVGQLKALESELDARRREAEESSTRKSRFLAAVSHDIRTPANAISLLAELMQRTASTPGMSQDIPEIATDLKRSAITLVDLVSDVLDLTRFDSGRVDLQESTFVLSEVIVEECRQLQPAATEKGLTLNCQPPQPTFSVRTDRVKLSRILGNLVSNAIKFTEKGSVTVSARRATDDGRGVVVEVIDTGCGIDPNHFQQIFDEFFQIKRTERDRSRGSGLGLAICRRLIDAMGGSIHVASEVGKGSTFTVNLPASAIVDT